MRRNFINASCCSWSRNSEIPWCPEGGKRARQIRSQAIHAGVNRGVMKRGLATLFWAAAVALAAAASGCASVEGGRLYTSGTEALDRGDVESAVDALQRAAALVPQASEIQNHLGLAYQAAGRSNEARAAFERAVDLDCDNLAARHNLAVIEGWAGGGSVNQGAEP